MRVSLLQLSKRLSCALSSSPITSSSSSHYIRTLSTSSAYALSNLISSPHSAIGGGNVYARRPWLAIQHRGVKVDAIHTRLMNYSFLCREFGDQYLLLQEEFMRW